MSVKINANDLKGYLFLSIRSKLNIDVYCQANTKKIKSSICFLYQHYSEHNGIQFVAKLKFNDYLCARKF